MQPTAYPIRPELLEQCWYSFMETGRLPNVEGFTADPTIIDSWERCKRRFDPRSTPTLVQSSQPALETALKTHTELLTVAIPYIEDIHQFIEGSDCAVLLADGTACILGVGGGSARQRHDRRAGLAARHVLHRRADWHHRLGARADRSYAGSGRRGRALFSDLPPPGQHGGTHSR